MARSACKAKCKGDPYVGPHEMTAVNNNGTVCHKKGAVIDMINIRQIKPYFTQDICSTNVRNRINKLEK